MKGDNEDGEINCIKITDVLSTPEYCKRNG